MDQDSKKQPENEQAEGVYFEDLPAVRILREKRRRFVRLYLRVMGLIFMAGGGYIFYDPGPVQAFLNLDLETVKILAGALILVGASDYIISFFRMLGNKK